MDHNIKLNQSLRTIKDKRIHGFVIQTGDQAPLNLSLMSIRYKFSFDKSSGGKGERSRLWVKKSITQNTRLPFLTRAVGDGV